MLCLLQSRERKRKFKLVRQQEKEQDDGRGSVCIVVGGERREESTSKTKGSTRMYPQEPPGKIDVLMICSTYANASL